VVLHGRVATVEVDAGADIVAFLAGGEEAERAAHAEANRADRPTGELLEVVDGAAQVLFGLFDLHGHHQLPGLVRLIDHLAVVEVGGERYEAFLREAVADVLDVAVEAPPFLDNDDALAGSAFGFRQVARGLSAVRSES